MAIPNAVLTNHHIGNSTEDIVTSIDVEDFPFLAEMMNGLYSNTIAAPLREYATNAWDSHVEAGVTRPIEITLPTPFSPQLVIQDFGVGMSIDDLRRTYSKYGRSDKRDSNAVAGQLGMGSKSGLCYAPSFTITAVKGGVRVVAVFTKNEQGLGVIKVLDTAGTDAPNGVTITIPVENKDIAAFTQEAEKMFGFWATGTVLINGKPPKTPAWRDGALWLDTERYTALVQHSAISRSYVIMGNVAYPVPDADVKDASGYVTNSHRFVAVLNIGDVDFTPSREEVKFTSRTKATLAELNDYIVASYDRAFSKAIAETPTPWDEMKLRVLWSNYNGRGLVLRGSQSNLIWDYNPNQTYGRRKAYASTQYQFSELVSYPDRVVVTGFPSKTLSTDARARLRTFAPNADRYVVCSTGTTGITHLEGRPNVIRYEDVLEATKPAKRDKSSGTRAPKEETRYTVSTKGRSLQLTAKEIADLATDEDNTVLYVWPKQSINGVLLDDTTYIVSLYSSAQLPRILRFVPTIREAYEELETRRERVAAALTEDDREQYHIRGHLSGMLTSLPANKVADPELRHVLTLRAMPFSDTLTAAINFGGIHIPEPSDKLPNFASRYPLLKQMYGSADAEEVLIYVNAKWQARRTAEVAAAAKAALTASNLTDVLAVA